MTDRFIPLRRQYLSLGMGELTAAAVFALAAATTGARVLSPRAELALWFALVPLLAVLVQAAFYWLSARRRIGTAALMPVPLVRTFRLFRVLDLALLAAGVIGVVAFLPQNATAAVLVVGVWLFAVAEYLNYYVVRLSYPGGEWWRGVRRCRAPVLARDLARAIRHRAGITPKSRAGRRPTAEP